MEVTGAWSAPSPLTTPPPPPPPLPRSAIPALLPPPAPSAMTLPPPLPPPSVPVLTAVPTLPGGPRPDGGIVRSPFASADPIPAGALAGASATDPLSSPGPTRTPLPPVTHAQPAPSRSQRRLHTRALVASIGVVASMVTSAVVAVALLQRRAAFVDVRSGGDVSFDRLTELDDRAVLLSYIDVGVLVIAGICFVVWFRRAYKNLRLMGRNAYTPGWAVFGWIVPIMNLFRPYQLAKELVRESPRMRGNEGTGIVGLWWMLYLVAVVGGQLAAALPDDTPDDVIRNDLLLAACNGAWLLTGVALLVIIRTVTRRQDAWFDPLPATPFLSPNGGEVTAVR